MEHIRALIRTLPDDRQPYFRSLADEAEQHQRSMENDCAAIRELVADMRLNEASLQFNLWAATQPPRRAPAGDN